ncbi:hypothetical protein [Spirosoma sp. KUDC1026]|uniref:hypothetical protein n=1 Tax=Spirosoma sp. KUDC1026 TaxID=2745947 RepID=UPI00159B90EC|nr:hypothetical protein [Spirosoma sp. KUDC1026]QKZ13822.1 hypothetical protein HU175_14750 [Spirosoma sp. KUDC1026]
MKFKILPSPSKQPLSNFTDFYDTYAPTLWGLILLANLPPSESETILANTLLKAWEQIQQPDSIDNYCLANILRIAYIEGLPISPALATAIRSGTG